MAASLQGGTRDLSPQSSSFAVTNLNLDTSLNCDEEAGCLALADVVGTLIRELIKRGVINGTIA